MREFAHMTYHVNSSLEKRRWGHAMPPFPERLLDPERDGEVKVSALLAPETWSFESWGEWDYFIRTIGSGA